MAEALGIVGVAIQLTGLSKEILRSVKLCKNSPRELEDLGIQSQLFSDLLDKFGELTSDDVDGNSVERSSRDRRLIRLISERSRDLCEDLTALVEQLRKTRRKIQKGPGKIYGSIRWYLQWYFEEPGIRVLQAAVLATTVSLNAFNTMDLYTALLKKVARLDQNVKVPQAMIERM